MKKFIMLTVYLALQGYPQLTFGQDQQARIIPIVNVRVYHETVFYNQSFSNYADSSTVVKFEHRDNRPLDVEIFDERYNADAKQALDQDSWHVVNLILTDLDAAAADSIKLYDADGNSLEVGGCLTNPKTLKRGCSVRIPTSRYTYKFPTGAAVQNGLASAPRFPKGLLTIAVNFKDGRIGVHRINMGALLNF